MYRFDLLNLIARRIGATRYLEIGVQDGETFSRVKVRKKTGVDPDKRSAATVFETSDAYFQALHPRSRFDLVFVDGLHTRDQVVRDVLNSLRHLSPSGVIVVHDCDPPDHGSAQEKQCGGVWCGTVWRGWLDLRADPRLADRWLGVVDTDLGCGVIARGPAPVPLAEPAPEDLDFDDFRKDRVNLLNLVTTGRIADLSYNFVGSRLAGSGVVVK